MKRVIGLIAASLILSACATTGTKTAAVDPTAENAAKSIATAEATTKSATATGFAWRDTAKMIEQAKEAAAKKEYAKAIAIADKANRQSENALQQAQMAKN